MSLSIIHLLKRRMINMKWKKTINSIVAFFLVIIIWQLVVFLSNIETALFPSPLKVGKGLLFLISDGKLVQHLTISLFRFLVGYLSAASIAIIVGLILGRIQKLWDLIDPIVQVLRPISPIAWAPFIVLWFGIGNTPAIVIIFIAAFFPVLLSTITGVKRVNRNYLKLAENLEIKQPYFMLKIIFPAAYPSIVSGLHIGLGTAWIFLVSGEMIGAQSGLGYLIIDSRNLFRLDLVLAGIVIIGVCGLILDKLIRQLEIIVEKRWGIN